MNQPRQIEQRFALEVRQTLPENAADGTTRTPVEPTTRTRPQPCDHHAGEGTWETRAANLVHRNRGVPQLPLRRGDELGSELIGRRPRIGHGFLQSRRKIGTVEQHGRTMPVELVGKPEKLVDVVLGAGEADGWDALGKREDRCVVAARDDHATPVDPLDHVGRCLRRSDGPGVMSDRPGDHFRVTLVDVARDRQRHDLRPVRVAEPAQDGAYCFDLVLVDL